MRTGCTTKFGYEFDQRYNEIGGYKISEWDLQEAVPLSTLMLPYGHYDSSIRKSVMFSLWTRPTIPFKLECESGTIKQDIASQISESIQIINGVE